MINRIREARLRGDVHTNSIDSTWVIFKSLIYGTSHLVNSRCFNRYMHEDVVRLNIGDLEVGTMDRKEAYIRQIGDKRITYGDLNP